MWIGRDEYEALLSRIARLECSSAIDTGEREKRVCWPGFVYMDKKKIPVNKAVEMLVKHLKVEFVSTPEKPAQAAKFELRKAKK